MERPEVGANFKPLVSVIVPVFNGERTIRQCVDSLEQQSLPRTDYEIIVVDDGSTDRTLSLVQPIRTLKVIGQGNAGPASARNRGIAEAQGSILVFTDADCRVDRFFLEKLVAPLLQQPDKVVAAQACYKTEQRSWVARLTQLEIEERYDEISKSDQITAVGTYGAAYWRRAVEAVGGFNQTYRVASGEDFALSYALTKDGKRAVFVPDAIVYHKHPDTLRRYFKSKMSRGYWRILLRHHYPAESRKDTYVPKSLIAQVLMIGLLPIAVVLGIGLIWAGMGRILAWIMLAYCALFLVSGMSFVRGVWRKDSVLTLASPYFLLVRAAAITSGMVVGILAFGLRPKRATET